MGVEGSIVGRGQLSGEDSLLAPGLPPHLVLQAGPGPGGEEVGESGGWVWCESSGRVVCRDRVVLWVEARARSRACSQSGSQLATQELAK